MVLLRIPFFVPAIRPAFPAPCPLMLATINHGFQHHLTHAISIRRLRKKLNGLIDAAQQAGLNGETNSYTSLPIASQHETGADGKEPQTMVEHQKTMSRETVIINELGLHARSAAQIAKLANRANFKVWLSKGGASAEATSIMDLLALECPRGTKVVVTIEDPSDMEVLNGIAQLIENGFGE